MSPPNLSRNEKGALEILEEATHLLRLAPVGALLCYYLGTLPFVLGFLFYWADMSAGGNAQAHLIPFSACLVCLFLWMKFWQTAFTSRLKTFLGDTPPVSWNPGRIIRVLCIQTAAAPWIFLVYPPALLILLPFGWCYSFFHTIGITGDGEAPFKESIRNAWRQAALWPGQNHRMIGILSLFSTLVFMNLAIAFYLLPMGLRTFLGIETVFSRSNHYLFNSTFWISIAGLTYLCLNPLVKAAYVLRCYYGLSLYSGEDLLAELRRLPRRAKSVLGLLIVVPVALLLCAASPSAAADSPQAPNARSINVISADKLDRAITEEIGKIDYSWRLPREKKPDKEESSGFLSQTLESLRKAIGKAWDWLCRTANRIWEWIEKHMPEDKGKNPSGESVPANVKPWLLAILAGIVLYALFLVFRHIMRARALHAISPNDAPSIRIDPDLSNESTAASDLPSGGWHDMARDLVRKGELRLALRAFYFATLANLAERNLLTLARFKSNLDYERELKRRAHSMPGIIEPFSENLRILERIWYGLHEVQKEAAVKFLGNYKRITADAHEQ